MLNNLPPGCTVGDLPGCSRAEMARELAAERYVDDCRDAIVAVLKRLEPECRIAGYGGLMTVDRDGLIEVLVDELGERYGDCLIALVLDTPESLAQSREIVDAAITELAARAADQMAADYDEADLRR